MSDHKKMKLSQVAIATLFTLFGTQQAYAQQQAEATEQNEEAIEKIKDLFQSCTCIVLLW